MSGTWQNTLWYLFVAAAYIREDFPGAYEPWNPSEDAVVLDGMPGTVLPDLSEEGRRDVYRDQNCQVEANSPRAGYRKGACSWRDVALPPAQPWAETRGPGSTLAAGTRYAIYATARGKAPPPLPPQGRDPATVDAEQRGEPALPAARGRDPCPEGSDDWDRFEESSDRADEAMPGGSDMPRGRSRSRERPRRKAARRERASSAGHSRDGGMGGGYEAARRPDLTMGERRHASADASRVSLHPRRDAGAEVEIASFVAPPRSGTPMRGLIRQRVPSAPRAPRRSGSPSPERKHRRGSGAAPRRSVANARPKRGQALVAAGRCRCAPTTPEVLEAAAL